MTKEELVEEVLKYSSFAEKLKKLTTTFEKFTATHNKMFSELVVVKKVNNLLVDRIVSLERNQLISSQYHRRESIELNSLPASLTKDVLEEKVCEALSLITKVTPSDLQACHHLSKSDRAIVKFKDRKLKQKIYYGRNDLKDMGTQLKNLGFNEKLYITDSICSENSKIFFKCRQLAKGKKIHATWFYNNKINVKVSEGSQVVNIFHESDLEKLLNIDNLDEFLTFM